MYKDDIIFLSQQPIEVNDEESDYIMSNEPDLMPLLRILDNSIQQHS